MARPRSRVSHERLPGTTPHETIQRKGDCPVCTQGQYPQYGTMQRLGNKNPPANHQCSVCGFSWSSGAAGPETSHVPRPGRP